MRSKTLKGPINVALSFLVPARRRIFKDSRLLLPRDDPTRCGAYQSSASGSLELTSDAPWRPGLAARYAERS